MQRLRIVKTECANGKTETTWKCCSLIEWLRHCLKREVKTIEEGPVSDLSVIIDRKAG